MVKVVGLPISEEDICELSGGDVPNWGPREGGEVVRFKPFCVGVSEGGGGVGEESGDGGDGGRGDFGAVAEDGSPHGVRLHGLEKPW